MKIVFFGTPPFVIPILGSLLKKFSVVAVVTAPDQKAGRKQLLTPSPIKTYVQNELYKSGKNSTDIPIFSPDNLSILNSQLSTLKPDLFVVAAYGYILPKELLSIPPFGAINIHPSLLPKFRGPTPVPSAILSGDTVTGTTIIKMDEEMDHGPILAIQTYPIHETDTTETLLKHLFDLGAEMLPDVITNYTNGKIQPEPQDHKKATYTKKISKTDGFIDLKNPPGKTKLNQMIRAYYPWPTVWTKVSPVIASKNDATLPAGRQGIPHNKTPNEKIIKFLPGGKVQMEGKSPIPIIDFLNGYPELKSVLEKLNFV